MTEGPCDTDWTYGTNWPELEEEGGEVNMKPRYICLLCLYEFGFNIDGCPECGSQQIVEHLD